MKSLNDIKKLVTKLKVKPTSEMKSKVLDEALEIQRNQNQQTTSDTHIWRLNMNSKITKVAVAAVIIIAVLIGINHFGGSIDGASVAWAEVIKNIDQVNDYTYRQRQINYSGVKPTGFEFTSEWETRWYYSSQFGIRWDRYQSGKLEAQFYQVLEEQQIVIISTMQKTFSRRNDSKLKKISLDPRRHIREVISKSHTDLGQQMIYGVLAEGIEVEGQKVSGPKLNDAVSRLWIDVQTRLPIRMESEGKRHGSDMFALLIQDEFQWNVDLAKVDFTPHIPEGFSEEDAFKSGPKKWDEVVASYMKRDTAVDFSPLEELGLLYDDQVPDQESHKLTGIKEIIAAMEQMIRSWPSYEDLHQSLKDELDRKLDIGSMSVEEMVALGVLLREKFWDAGGTYSAVSYRYGYMSRVLLELAYAQRPDDLVVGDELAEAIMAVGTIKATEGFAETLLELRSAQFRQIRQEVEAGRKPNWDDFARGCDVAYLAAAIRPEESVSTVDWLIQFASEGRWMPCMETLEWMRPLVEEGRTPGINIYYRIKPGFPEEISYARRAPSFKGPRSRIIIPIPEMQEPSPDDQPEVHN
jgi:hypothetical protein